MLLSNASISPPLRGKRPLMAFHIPVVFLALLLRTLRILLPLLVLIPSVLVLLLLLILYHETFNRLSLRLQFPHHPSLRPQPSPHLLFPPFSVCPTSISSSFFCVSSTTPTLLTFRPSSISCLIPLSSFRISGSFTAV